MPGMRYLAIDLGGKRTGLAVGDDLTGQAGPVGVIETSDHATLLRQLKVAIDEHGPDALVIGIPLNMDGTVGPAAKKAQALAILLEQSTGMKVHGFDERLTTFEADDLMKQSGLTHKQKKARRDAIAAAAILRDFLASRRDGTAQ
jgi:putative Holliday junction resolvase